MILLKQVITSVVLWISMVTLRGCIALEQSDVRYDNESSANKPTVLLTALDGPLALKRRSFAKLSIDVRQNASFDRVYQKSVKRGELAIFNFLERFPQVGSSSTSRSSSSGNPLPSIMTTSWIVWACSSAD